MALALLLAAGCSTTKKLYDGPERDPAELVTLSTSNSYVFSINDRRTDHAREPNAQLLLLPGTQQLIVHLDDRMAESYGHVGVRTVFCAQAGRQYTVYPVPDMIARLWEPAVRDEATGQDVSPRPCANTAAPIGAAPQPTPPPVAPAATPKPAVATPPPAAAPAAAAPAAASRPAPTPTSPAGPPVPATTAPPAQAAPPVAPPPGVLAPGATAQLRAPARTRSLADAPVVKGLDAGVAVTLKVVLKKDTGAWWYVTGPSGSGWVREGDLEPSAP
jgi:hypothetical protein